MGALAIAWWFRYCDELIDVEELVLGRPLEEGEWLPLLKSIVICSGGRPFDAPEGTPDESKTIRSTSGGRGGLRTDSVGGGAAASEASSAPSCDGLGGMGCAARHELRRRPPGDGG